MLTNFTTNLHIDESYATFIFIHARAVLTFWFINVTKIHKTHRHMRKTFSHFFSLCPKNSNLTIASSSPIRFILIGRSTRILSGFPLGFLWAITTPTTTKTTTTKQFTAFYFWYNTLRACRVYIYWLLLCACVLCVRVMCAVCL